MRKDVRLQDLLIQWNSTDQLPISLHCGDAQIQGIPSQWNPKVAVRNIDCNITETTVVGVSPEGLEIRMECKVYHDFAAVEYQAFLTNRGIADTPVIDRARMVDTIPGSDAVLYHGNGDTKGYDGYEWWYTPLKQEPMTIEPNNDGTSCNGAFPYMRLLFEGCGVNLAFGWTGVWTVDLAQTEKGVSLSTGQRRFHMVIHPGETIRLPSLTMLAYLGDEDAARNSWRRFYFAHIMPKQNYQRLEPKCCMHLFKAGGKPEFTGATEENQLGAIEAYLARGIKPDVWWIDAGWYPCDYDWRCTGNWYPNPENFPRGLKPIGDKCQEKDMEFLLWFEPERLVTDTDLARNHPEWVLDGGDEGELASRRVIDLGIPECCDYMIDMLDGYVKEFGVDIYRQDYNVRHARYWQDAETEDRIGAKENLHIQGYYRMWDTLLARNPGLLIDSCASGGRRNDIETMRRSVPLHYTDVGYGNHPVKLKQHREMFEWIPYFRAHNQNWCNPDGTYSKQEYPADRYSYYVAMAPALTDILEYDADEEAYALAREMQPIWRKAAKRMLGTDYYPLTECRKSSDDFYAAQFYDPATRQGLVHMVNGSTAAGEHFTMKLRGLEADLRYTLTSVEQNRSWECTGAELMAGVSVQVAKKAADIWFFEQAKGG